MIPILLTALGYTHALERLSLGEKKEHIQKIEELIPDSVNTTGCMRVHSSIGADAHHVEEDIEMIAGLSRVPKLLVVSYHSTMTYKGRTLDIKEVGREQGVRYVLEGSLRKMDNEIRVTAQLIDAITGHHVWADRYQGSMDDFFALQDKIIHNVEFSASFLLQTFMETWCKIRLNKSELSVPRTILHISRNTGG